MRKYAIHSTFTFLPELSFNDDKPSRNQHVLGIHDLTSFKSHLTSGASVCHENAATYSACNKGHNICGIGLAADRPLDDVGDFFRPTYDSWARYGTVCARIT